MTRLRTTALQKVKAPIITLVALGTLAGPFSSSFALLDKTRFVAHLGAGFFAFHHWVLSPFQHGQFSAGAPGRTGSMVKGGLALLFAVHEVKVAENIAHKSNDPLLQKLDASLMKLEGSFGSLGQSLKQGKLDPAQINSLAQDTSGLASTAAAGGQPIRDIPTPIPGL